ncbi:hypothetical protein [Neobacillus niacini]|uniref:hypothetical protein n=1 Tax=Neobacillus niacini TaxID=86668 RepID=UPI0028613101|nr:hypothetical protein [Neobacillus niacini]MDR7001613.1 hypothetical protein [Neobacillus niacini]
MHFKWVFGKKSHYMLAVLWTILAIGSFAKGHWVIGILGIIIALNDFKDARAGIEVTMFEFQTGKAVK